MEQSQIVWHCKQFLKKDEKENDRKIFEKIKVQYSPNLVTKQKL